MAQDDESQQRKEEPIIIKKKKVSGHGGHHGGAWKVAYADFVTAMMAFFIVMWILASSEEVKKEVTSYFQDPGAFNFLTGKKAIPIDLQLQPQGKGEGKGEGKEKSANNKPIVISFDENSKDTVYTKINFQAIKDSIKASAKVERLGQEFKKYLDDMMQKRPDLKDILSSIKIEMTNEGLRIELIESSESLFFEVGSSRLSKEAVDILNKLASEIGKMPNNVDIEGHTDSRQYSGKSEFTNWELSTDRANSARRLMERNGLWQGQVQKVIGYADTKLRVPNNPFDISNRRISILIRQLSVKDFLQNNQVEANANE